MPKKGKCAICGKEAELSYDHIPPKCCGNNGDSYYISFTPECLGGNTKITRHKHSQNGIKFQNICSECNNGLGARYDKELGYFRQFMLDVIEKKKPSKGFDLRKVVKGLIGHLLAASKYDTSLPAEMMRDFYLDKNDKLLNSFSFMTCYYPYQKNIFILKNYIPITIGMAKTKPEGMLSSLYFYPFAFILCDKQELPFGIDLFEALKVAPLQLKFLFSDWQGKSPIWPVAIDDHHALLVSDGGKDSVYK